MVKQRVSGHGELLFRHIHDRRRDVGMFEESRKNLGKSWGEESVIASAAIGSRLAYSAWG